MTLQDRQDERLGDTPERAHDAEQGVEQGADQGVEDDAYSEARRRRRYGGVNWGAGFFGWLVVASVAVVLSGIAGGTVAVLGRTADLLPGATGQPRTVGVAAVAICFGVLVLAFYSGGYVAGRMSRYDGAKQGLGVWVIGLLLTGAAVGALLLLGSRVDVLTRLPGLEAPAWARGLGGVAIAVVGLLGSLLAVTAGGKVGCRYHRKVDEAAYL